MSTHEAPAGPHPDRGAKADAPPWRADRALRESERARPPEAPAKGAAERATAAAASVPGAGSSSRAGSGVRVSRIAGALRRQDNWVQLLEFGVVGTSGYAVNLIVYTLLLKEAGLHYVLAATGSFVLAASWNYWWNRTWTFRAQRGRFAAQGMRFFVVSATVYLANVGLLAAFVSAGMGKIVAQAVAIVLVTPLNFLGNKLWSFRGGARGA